MFQFNRTKHFLLISIFLLAVFILSVSVWYSPTLFKGYAPYSISPNAVMGRSIYQTGLYSVESNHNVILSSNLLESQGHISARGNKLTSLLYGAVFKIIGLPDANDLVLLSIFINALTLLVFSGTVLYLFNFKTSLVFSLIYIFLPFNWALPYGLGVYEFASFFLSLFFLFYFYGSRQKNRQIYLVISGIFLALSCLSKEAMLLIVPFLCVFLWLTKKKIYLVYILVPFIILFAFFWLPDIGHNVYMQLFTTQISEESKSSDFSFYSHLYSDPYTYHFEQKEFIEDIQSKITGKDWDLMERIGGVRSLKIMAVQEINFSDRFKIGFTLSLRHIFRFISLEDIAGPLIFLLMLLGVYVLKQRDKHLCQFFVYWILTTIFLLSFVVLAQRNHLMDFSWAIALLISLGSLSLSEIIIDYLNLKGKKELIINILVLLLVLYNFILVNHVAWSKTYDNSNNLMIEAYSQEIKKLDITDSDVIAINLSSNEAFTLNYLTNKSVVPFGPETIRNLLEKDKLNFAFEEFNVKYVLGYSNELTEEIFKQTEVVNIATNSLEPVIPEMSRNKSWLMNTIK